MREYLDLSERLLREVALAKLEMVGLSPRDSEKLPSELSGPSELHSRVPSRSIPKSYSWTSRHRASTRSQLAISTN
jgi:hypothetical protein